MDNWKYRFIVTMILLRWFLVFISVFFKLTIAEDVKISKTIFDHGSNKITYFDDSSNILNINDDKLYISHDNGVSWDDITATLNNGDSNIHITNLFYDHNYKERAFIMSNSNKFWFTNDKGQTWNSFDIDFEWKPFTDIHFQTNVNSRSNVIIAITQCENIISCHRTHYFTNDEFGSQVKKVEGDNIISCIFTTTKFLPENINNILCTANIYDQAGRAKYTKVFSSNDWFKTQKEIKGMDDVFIYEIEVVNSFIIAKCLTDRFNSEAYVDLYVSKDGFNFQKAHFPGDLKSEAFTILPSTDNSLHVSVWGLKKAVDGDFSRGISDLYASDFNGINFRKLNKLSDSEDFYGFYSVEKISNLDGVWLGNVLKANTANSGFFSFFPDINSMMSFDDGRSWVPLKYEIDPNSDVKSYCTSSDNCKLNLLNAIQMDGDGTFESGPTPGILLGLGMVSNTLALDYDKLSTWISRDGGYSWTVALKQPCVFSIGDQGNIIIAIPDVMNPDKRAVDRLIFYYSTDQGLTWQEGHIDSAILPMILTTTVDGSSQKFIFSGFDIQNVENLHNLDLSQLKYIIYALDFSDIFNGKVCSGNDMEEFVARKGTDSDSAICIMGHKEKFQRRKQDAKCFVKKLYEDVKPVQESCPCDKVDYECNEGFLYENGECVEDLSYFRILCLNNKNKKVDNKKIPKLAKIPGNTCQDSSFKLDENKDYFTVDCESILEDSRSFNIKTQKNNIPGSLLQYVYMDQSLVNFKDESIIVLNSDRKIFISHDGGMHFFYANFRTDNVVGILADNYDGNHVVLLGEGNYYFETINRAQSFYKKILPSSVNIFGFVPMVFHPTDASKYIFIGSTDGCFEGSLEDCNSVAYITVDGGKTWNKLLEGARNCDFAGSRFKHQDDSLIICEQRNPDKSVRIVSSKQMFSNPLEIKVHFDRTVGMAPDDGFIVVAAIVNEDNLNSYTTVDGETWALAEYPYDFVFNKEQAYTVLKSNSKSIYLHVTTSNEQGKEYGSILKSNSNGTSYVLSENFVNRNTIGFVDFEKIEGVEGISLINVVDNAEEIKTSDNSKKVKTKITHNDASEWSYLNPPPVDSDDKKYDCVSSRQPIEKCSLNLHGFTERTDFRDTYSSGSAIGMMIGNGNVGPYLDDDINNAGTFLTRDGGITWKEISKQPLSWEFGDQGGIIVLIDQIHPTKELKFSVDQGDSWETYVFNEEEVSVNDIATIPSDTSRKFVIFAAANDGGKFLAIGVDFHGVFNRQCDIDFDKLDEVSKSDYEYWTPKHPFLADNCLFGREARYLRRKPESSDCFIGNTPLGDAYKFVRNCSCTRRDYECDYNFAKDIDGTCKLVAGLLPKDPKEVCINQNVFEYFEPTGYRKIPLSSCVGGKELEKYEPHACPGKQKQFDKEHGSGITTGSNLLFVVFIPLTAFCVALWFFYDRGIRRNGGFKRLGAIRLEGGEGETYGFPTRIENNTTDKIVNRVVDMGVMAFVAGVTVINYIRKVIAGRRNPLDGGRYSSLGQNQVFLDEDEILGNENGTYNEGDDENDDLFNIDDSENDAFDDDAASLTSDVIGQA